MGSAIARSKIMRRLVNSPELRMPIMASNIGEVADSLLKDLALALARILIGGSVIYFHGWGEVVGGFNHFFGPKAPWALPGLLESAGLPYGLAFAVLFSVLAGAAAWALIIGLLSRVAALVLLGITGVLFFVAQNDLLRELAVVYSSAFIVLFLAGPGRLAVDALFTRRRETPPAPKLRRSFTLH
jgi:uncharacterized membrane protein YphA (DoxX/SURF4 family)